MNSTDETSTTDLAPGLDDVSLQRLSEKVATTDLSLSELLKEMLLPAAAEENTPAVLQEAPEINFDQRKALDRLAEVFGKVVPRERRTLEPQEVSALLEERKTLDEISKLAESRKEQIRSTVCHHLDVEAEQAGRAGPDVPRDRQGHYVLTGEVSAPSESNRFSREVRELAPALDRAALKSLVETGELANEDYLSMTRQIREVDENLVMLALRKKPSLLPLIAKASRPGSKGASLYVRKKK